MAIYKIILIINQSFLVKSSYSNTLYIEMRFGNSNTVAAFNQEETTEAEC